MLRGLKTLALRVERAQENAGIVARFLARHPRVSRVHWLGLEGPGAGDLQPRPAAHALHRVDRQVQPLQPVEPARVEEVVAVFVAAVSSEVVGRRVKRRALQPVVAVETIRHVAGDGEEVVALGERRRVHGPDRLPHLAVFGAVREGAVGRAVEVVGLAVLVKEPGHLARVADEEGRELGRDHEVDRGAVALRHVEQPPGQRLAHDLRHRVPLEGNGGDVGAEAPALQVGLQLGDQDLGSPGDERRLRGADEDGLHP